MPDNTMSDRKPYSPPTLVRYGNMAKLTQAGAGTQMESGTGGGQDKKFT